MAIDHPWEPSLRDGHHEDPPCHQVRDVVLIAQEAQLSAGGVPLVSYPRQHPHAPHFPADQPSGAGHPS